MSFAADLLRVVAILPRVEWGRRFEGPAALVARLRSRGAGCPRRDGAARTRLRRIIARIDARFPDGGNCYRRALLEIALDAGTAAEPLHLGLRPHGGPRSGHAWLGDLPATAGTYEVRLDL